MHGIDDTCVSDNYIKESKSVDCITIMKAQRILLSGTADQTIRFWDLTDITANKPPLFKFEKFLDKEESLSAFAVDETNQILLTGDTAGRIKKFDLSGINEQLHELAKSRATAAKLKAKSGFAGTSKRIRKL